MWGLQLEAVDNCGRYDVKTRKIKAVSVILRLLLLLQMVLCNRALKALIDAAKCSGNCACQQTRLDRLDRPCARSNLRDEQASSALLSHR